MENCTTRTSSRVLIVVISLVVIIALAAAALILTLYNPVGEMGEKEEIRSAIDSYEDKGHAHVWEYLVDFGIGEFDYRKFNSIESMFNKNYVGELPSPLDMAIETATLYLDYFYDTDRSDKAPAEDITSNLLRAYVKSTGDKYAAYRTYDEVLDFIDDMSGSYVGLGVEVLYEYNSDLTTLKSLSISRVIKNSGAEEAGMLAGDYIIAVEGVSVSGSTQPDIDSLLRGEEGTQVTVTVKRGNDTFDLTVTRRFIESSTVYYDMLDGGIGYIAISSFEENTDEYFAEALYSLIEDGAKGLVFDVRNNLGGYVDSCVNMLSELVPYGTVIATAEFSDGSRETYTSVGKTLIDLPIVVMCNQNTASASELFTAAIRDWSTEGLIDAAVVGYTTYGKGVMQSTFTYMLDYSMVSLTNAYCISPSGEKYDGVGIVPDYPLAIDEDPMKAALGIIRPKLDEDGMTAA